jgi:hypothetical protein
LISVGSEVQILPGPPTGSRWPPVVCRRSMPKMVCRPGMPDWACRRRFAGGDVAQLGEHLLCKQGVVGSNPIISTTPAGVGCERGLRPAAWGLPLLGFASLGVCLWSVCLWSVCLWSVCLRLSPARQVIAGAAAGVWAGVIDRHSEAKVRCWRVVGTGCPDDGPIAVMGAIRQGWRCFVLCQGESGSGASLGACDVCRVVWPGGHPAVRLHV